MTKPYSSDLRERIVAYVDSGHSRRAAADRFDVSPSFAVKLMHRVRDTGVSSPARMGRPRGSGKLAPYGAFLIACIEDLPDITMPELAAKLEAEHGVEAHPASLSRFVRKAGFTYKKIPDGFGARTLADHPGATGVDRPASAKDAP